MISNLLPSISELRSGLGDLRALRKELSGGGPRRIAGLFVLGLLHVAVMLTIPLLVEELFARATADQGMEAVWQIGALLLVTGVGASVLAVGLELLAVRMLYRSVRTLENRLFDKILRIEPAHHEERGVGYLQARVREDVMPMSPLTAAELTPYLVIALQLMGAVILLFTIDVAVATAAVVFGVFVTLGNVAAAPLLRGLAQRTQESRSRLSGYVQDVLKSVFVIKSCNAEEQEGERFRSQNDPFIALRRRLSFYRRFIGEMNTATGRIGFALIAVLGAFRIAAGDLTAGGFMAAVVFINILLYSSKSLVNYVPRLATAWASLARVREILDLPEEEQRFGELQVPVEGDLVLEGVTFAHDDRPLFEDLELAVQRGEKVAVVGPSGAGKSTLVKLMLGLLTPQAGTVRLGDTEVRDFDLRHLRHHVGYIPQTEKGLLRRSVADNVGLGDLGAERGALEAAARQARALDFIRSLPDGWDSVIGEERRNLSGGECQRVSLARELLRQPKLLVIDEATAHLDPLTEREVLNTVRQVFDDTTCIIISHRLRSITHFDRILVFDRGRLVEQGRHRELLAAGGLYRRMFSAQEEEAPEAAEADTAVAEPLAVAV